MLGGFGRSGGVSQSAVGGAEVDADNELRHGTERRLLDFQFGRSEDGGILFSERRKIDGRSRPTAMAKRAARYLPARGYVADQLNAIRIGSFRTVQLLISALDAIDYGSERKMPVETGTAIGMKAADRRADLIVGVIFDIFHQEIDQARVPLENMQDL